MTQNIYVTPLVNEVSQNLITQGVHLVSCLLL